MTEIPYRSALIIGAGPGISGSLTRLLREAGLPVVVAARRAERLEALAARHPRIDVRLGHQSLSPAAPDVSGEVVRAAR